MQSSYQAFKLLAELGVMALESCTTRSQSARFLDGGRQLCRIVDGDDAALTLGNLAHEIGLVVVDVLAIFRAARHHDWNLARCHRFDETRRPTVSNDDIRSLHARTYLRSGNEPLPLTVLRLVAAVARLNKDRLGHNLACNQFIYRSDQAVELLLMGADRYKDQPYP